MLSIYPAIFYHEHDGKYSVVFPDLNHLSTCGDTYNEAMEMAVDCLASYLYDLKKSNQPLPSATPINQLDLHCEDDDDDNYSDSDLSASMITVDVEEYAKKHFNASVKKTLTIPRWMNDKAISAGINFSKLLQNALITEFQTKNLL